MKTSFDADVAIIGAGTAGMAAYREVTKRTKRVLLIDPGPLGTTCARVGCMPSKLLIAPAEAIHATKRFQEFGLSAHGVGVNGSAVMARVRRERDRFVGFATAAIDGFDKDHLVKSSARFVDDHTLELDGNTRVTAEKIIIATGSRPNIPNLFEAAHGSVITNDDVFEWTDLPRSVAVFGAGVIGLELGQALHRLGVRVRLIGLGGAVGPITDPVVMDYARKTFKTEFSADFDAADISLDHDGEGALVQFRSDSGEEIRERFDYVLAATGRRPNTDRLALENTSIDVDGRGAPLFDPQSMKTSTDHIFITGDAAGALPLLHEAADEGRIAGENAVSPNGPLRRQRRTPLGIVFSDPQIAIAGASYDSLQTAGVAFQTGSVSFEDQGRARVMLRHKGVLRVYGEGHTGKLLGAELFGPAAEHIGHLLAWSISAGQTVEEALQQPFYHPVIEEGLRSALRDLFANLEMGPPPPLRCIDCGPGA